MQHTKIEKKNIVLFVTILILAGFSVFGLAASVRFNSDSIAVQSLDEGWDAVAHGEVYKNITLSETRFASFNRGDTLEITTILPFCEILGPSLEVYSVHSMVDVYIDGKHIYNYGREYYDRNRMLGYGWNLVALPDNFSGKTVKIVFTVTEDNAFEGMPAIGIVNNDAALKNLLISQRLYLSIGLFLVVCGALGMFFSLILAFRQFAALKMFCIMLFAYLIGVYTLANSDLLTLFNMDMAHKCFLEYSSLYSFMVPFTVYFSDWITEKDFPKQLKKYYNLWVVVELTFVASTLFFHLTNIIHFPWFVTSSHVVMAGTLGLIVSLTVARIRNVGKVDTGLITGFALALVFAVLELVRYNVAKFGTGFKDNKYNSTIGIAALIVVITLFADYLSKVTRNIAREAEAQAFEKMAYMDELTGILNRRGLEKPMQLFKNTKSLYALVSVDMNLLKMMNDTYGHATGDRALSLLAKKLTEAYPEPCTVARTGGDEFVVAIPHTTRDWVERHTCIFLERLYEHNLKGENVTLSAAYGIAYSDEAASPEEVLALADERMYAKKKESKMQRE